MTHSGRFEKIATRVSQFTGRAGTFGACCLLIVIWAASGPVFHFSDTWQLIINTSTTIVTFLMVFLIQNTQNRDGIAIQTKLDELIRVSAAQNRFVGIERLTEQEIDELRRTCEERALKESEKEQVIEEFAEKKVERHKATAKEAAEEKVKVSARRALRR